MRKTTGPTRASDLAMAVRPHAAFADGAVKAQERPCADADGTRGVVAKINLTGKRQTGSRSSNVDASTTGHVMNVCGQQSSVVGVSAQSIDPYTA
jgi:hypothetical protein